MAVDNPLPGQVCLEVFMAIVMPVTAGMLLKGLWCKDKSMLEKVHLKASVAVHEVMLEHLKVCAMDKSMREWVPSWREYSHG